MRLINSHKSNLHFIVPRMTRYVGNGLSADFRHEHHVGKAADALFNPNFVEKITLRPVEVLIEVEAGITVC